MLRLKVLAREPMHGFGIAQRIQQLSDEVLTVGEGIAVTGSLSAADAALDPIGMGPIRE